jgi:hypothetical protein
MTSSSLSFFSLISSLISEADNGLFQALDATKDQNAQFTVQKIEMDIKGFVISDNGLKIVSSNAEEVNYYGNKAESVLKLTFKLDPK